jgi:lipoprotein-anchoring transpeptidase ErfK/SrfK
MTRSNFLLMAAGAAMVLSASPAGASERYTERPPVVISPDLSAPWVMQLGTRPGQKLAQRKPGYATRMFSGLQRKPGGLFGRAPEPPQAATEVHPQLDPKFLPRQVDYASDEKPGTIIIDSAAKFLYLIQPNGKARRYGVGVGQEGMSWTGVENITMKREWPEWRPPVEMIERERAKGNNLPARMDGGPANPLGSRALYLGATLYRIHGTNAPWTIGTTASSGCIRLRNEDVVDLYERVPVGTKVIVM